MQPRIKDRLFSLSFLNFSQSIYVIMYKYLLYIFFLICTCCQPYLDSGKCLRLCFNTYPTTTDPRKSADFTSSTLISLLYEGLTRCKSNGSVELALADKVEISSDGKIYLFHLRKSHWSNKTPITAYDFERSWKQILHPQFPSPCAYLLYPIKNAEACRKGSLSLDKLGIQAIHPFLLRVELEEPCPYFFALTAFPLFAPTPPQERDLGILSETIICNGPFRIERVLTNQEILLTRNEHYWDSSLSSLDKIQIQIVPDEITALQMFERGELDWLGGPFSPIHLEALESLHRDSTLHFFPTAATTFCCFNTERPPFSNTSLRKAFSYAINRPEIVEKITQTGQIPATRYLPPSLLNGEDKELYAPFDPLQAKAYLQKALKELQMTPEELEQLTLYFGSSQIDKRLAQALQHQWKETLNIQVQLKQFDLKTHIHFLHKKDYQIALTSWIAQFHDPINILDRFADKENAKNYSGWQNPQFRQLLQEASQQTTEEKRKEVLEKAEELLAEHMPIAPIYHWKNPCLLGPRIEQMASTPTGGLLLEQFQLKRES